LAPPSSIQSPKPPHSNALSYLRSTFVSQPADDLILNYDSNGKVVAITLSNYSSNVETVDLQALGVYLLAA